MIDLPTSYDFVTVFNAIVCGIIAARIFAFNRTGSSHNRWAGWLAYILIIASASVPIRVVMGAYEGGTDLAELVINLALCCIVLYSKGSVVQLFKSVRRQS